MTDTVALKKIIEESGFKQAYLAKKLGLTSFGFANKVNNKTEFKATEIKILCEILNIKSLREKETIFFNDKVDE